MVKIAPVAMRMGFKSDMGLAVTMLPPITYIQYTTDNQLSALLHFAYSNISDLWTSKQPQHFQDGYKCSCLVVR